MRRAFIAVLVLATAALVGCTSRSGGGDVNAAHSSGLATPASDTPSSPSSAAAAKSPRGAIPKSLGEPAGLCTDLSCKEFGMTFTVDKIEVDATCTEEYAAEIGAAPKNGHFVVLTMTVKTTDKFTEDIAYVVDFSPFAFQFVGPDGITEPSGDGGYGCMAQNEVLPSGPYAPSSQYTGKVVLDSKNTAGVILLRMTGTSVSWEWTF